VCVPPSVRARTLNRPPSSYIEIFMPWASRLEAIEVERRRKVCVGLMVQASGFELLASCNNDPNHMEKTL